MTIRNLTPPRPQAIRVPRRALEGTRARPDLKNLPLANIHLSGHAQKQNYVWAHNGAREIPFGDIAQTIRNYDLCYYTGPGFNTGEKKYQFLKRIGAQTLVISGILATDRKGETQVLVPTVIDRNNDL